MAPMTTEKYHQKFKAEQLRKFLKVEKSQTLSTLEYNRKVEMVKKAMSLNLGEEEIDQWLARRTMAMNTNANINSNDDGDSSASASINIEQQRNDDAPTKPPLTEHLKAAIREAVKKWKVYEQQLFTGVIPSSNPMNTGHSIYEEMMDLQAEASAINHEEFMILRLEMEAEDDEDLLNEAVAQEEDDAAIPDNGETAVTLAERDGGAEGGNQEVDSHQNEGIDDGHEDEGKRNERMSDKDADIPQIPRLPLPDADHETYHDADEATNQTESEKAAAGLEFLADFWSEDFTGWSAPF